MYQIKSNVLKNIKINGWEFCGYASVFDVLDAHNDIVVKGSFQNSISKPGIDYISLLNEHNLNQNVGKILSLKEDNYGLFVEGIIDESLPQSLDLVNKVKECKVLNFSIGYIPKLTKKIGKVNYILDLDLIEVSFVSVPANKSAVLINLEATYLNPNIAQMLENITTLIS